MPDFLLLTGLIAIVLTVSALASGLVVRAPLSFPILFLGLGFALGEHGLGLLAIDPHDKTLEAIATLSLGLDHGIGHSRPPKAITECVRKL